MAILTPQALADRVLRVLQDVLIHQRPRWAHLMLHCRQYEGWWKAEMRSALDGWCWQVPSIGSLGVISEVKPKYHGLGGSAHSFDIVVGAWDAANRTVDLTRGPRIWVELKERGTWWDGGPAKAFGEANAGLRSDLKKWTEIPWTDRDVAVACQIISHRGRSDETLPTSWQRELDAIAVGNSRCLPTMSVGCPSWNSDEILWVTIQFFNIHGATCRK